MHFLPGSNEDVEVLRCCSENALDVAALGVGGLDRVLTTGQGDGSIVEQIDDDAGPGIQCVDVARFMVDGEQLKNDPADPNGAHWFNDNPSAVRMQVAGRGKLRATRWPR